MSLNIEAERIILDEARQVLRISGKGPGDIERLFKSMGKAGGGAGGAVLGPVAVVPGIGLGGAAASALHDAIFGSSSEDKKKKMRQRARVAAGKLQDLLGREIEAIIRKMGMGRVYDRIAQGAQVVTWRDFLPDNVKMLRGVPRGAGQDAAAVFMNAAAPRSKVAPPRRLFSSQEWAILSVAWGGFGDVAARTTAVMAAIDAGGLPDLAAGAQALKDAYPEEWRAVERETGRPLFQTGGQARREAGQGKTIQQPKARRETRKTDAKARADAKKAGGGGMLLAAGLGLGAIGLAVAAAARWGRR